MSALLYVPYAYAFTATSKPNEVVNAYLKLDSEGGILAEDKRQVMQDIYPDLGEVHYSERTSIIYLITGCHIISTKYIKEGATDLTDEGRNRLEEMTHDVTNEQVTIVTHVITGFTVVRSAIHDRSAVVTVEYDVIGSIVDDFYEFKPKYHKFRFDFTLSKEHNDKWVIRDYPAPLMGWKTVTQHLKELHQTAYEPAYLDKAMQEITRAAAR